MKKTPIQLQIEASVTNGMGYDSRTKFIQGRESKLGAVEKKLVNSSGITEENVKDSRYGLRAHLAKLNAMNTLRKYFDSEGLLKRARYRLSLGNQIASYEYERRNAIVLVGMKRLVDIKIISLSLRD